MNTESNWTQIRVTGAVKDRESICAIMTMLDPGLQIEDYSDFDTDFSTIYGELVDESILNADKTTVKVSVYIPEERNPVESLSFLRERFSGVGLNVSIECIGLEEESWAESWKQYFQPIHVGNHILICPPWQSCECAPDTVKILMDPGMAFGTGSHETTRLVIRLLEKYLTPGDRVLDVGTGSGILSICASKLGASSCYAYDLDPVAVKVAASNMEANGIRNVVCGRSDLLADVDRTLPYTLVTANIIAEIIMKMAPDLPSVVKQGSVVLTSGIVDEKQIEVVTSLGLHDFMLIDELHENGWAALAFRYEGPSD